MYLRTGMLFVPEFGWFQFYRFKYKTYEKILLKIEPLRFS